MALLSMVLHPLKHNSSFSTLAKDFCQPFCYIDFSLYLATLFTPDIALFYTTSHKALILITLKAGIGLLTRENFYYFNYVRDTVKVFTFKGRLDILESSLLILNVNILYFWKNFMVHDGSC